MKIDECTHTNSEITQLQVVGEQLIAFSTKDHGLKFFSLLELEVTLNLASEHLNSQTSAIAFSTDSKHVALANANVIDVIHVSSAQLVNTISLSDEVEVLTFDLSNIYIIIGTKNGYVLQYRYNKPFLLSRLHSFTSSGEIYKTKIKQSLVSAFAFHKDTLACSGNKGSIVIIDLHSLSNKELLVHDKVRANALCFVDKDTIISGSIDGVIHILSLQDKNFHKQISVPFTKIKQIILMPNPNYILVSGQSDTVAMIDIKRYKIAQSKYITFEDEVQKIALLDNETMLVALKNMKILKIDLPSIQKLKSLILHNSLDEAFKLIENEPMLLGSNEHKELEKKFDNIYIEAAQALINQDEKFALQITDMFKDISSLKEKIKLLFKAIKHYPRFQIHYSEQKLSLAYAMAYKFPTLQYTWQFKKMEETWRDAFKSAQKQILRGSKNDAKQYLDTYATVISKKAFIQLILKHNNEFIEFLKAIGTKNFTVVDKLASKHSVLTEIPAYIIFNKKINSDLLQAKNNLEIGDVKSAYPYLDKIKDVPRIKKEFITLTHKYEKILEIQEHYERNDFNSCYEMIDKNNYITSITLSVLLEKHWSKIIRKCEEHAFDGNITGIKNTLGELMELKTRRDKIGNLLRLSFHVKIKMLLEKKALSQAETIIYSYIDLFGLDQEIKVIMKMFEISSSSKLAITYTQNHKPKRDAWINSELIMGKLP